MNAIQDYYPKGYGHCYGCGNDNPRGHKLKSYLVENRVVATFKAHPMYSGGFPDNAYGGLLASLLDCHGIATAAAFAQRAQGKNFDEPIGRFVTGSLKVDFKRPTPLGVELELEGTLRSLEGRKAIVDLKLVANGEVCVTGEMLAIQLKT